MHGRQMKTHWRASMKLQERICRRCGERVEKSDNPDYSYQCFSCDEDLYEFETEIAIAMSKVYKIKHYATTSKKTRTRKKYQKQHYWLLAMGGRI